MRKLIKNTDWLPSEFKLSNYDGMDKLTAREWSSLLEHRSLLLNYIEQGHYAVVLDNPKKPTGTEEVTQWERQLVLRELMLSLKAPLSLDKSYYSIITEEFGVEPLIGEYIQSYFIDKKPVTDFRVNQCMNMYELGDFKKIALQDRRFEVVMDHIRVKTTKKSVLANYPICINPYFSDKEILECLQEELPKIRQKIGIIPEKKQLTKHDLQIWCGYKLLPYIDLILWSEFFGYRITRSVIASALYVKGEYGEDTLRKSVEPLWREIAEFESIDMSEDLEKCTTIDLLISLAASEIGKNH